jgi:hypothetical protein
VRGKDTAVKIKSKRPGPLVIADARLALAPGEVVEIAQVTPQTQRALERGLVEEVAEDTPVGAPEAPKPTPAVPAELQKLSPADLIEQIDHESDPKTLEALLQTEKRKPVAEALKRRLQEVRTSGGK